MLNKGNHQSKYSEKNLYDFITAKANIIKFKDNKDCFLISKLLEYCKIKTSKKFIIEFIEKFGTIYNFITNDKYKINLDEESLEILRLIINEIFKRKDNLRNLTYNVYSEEFINGQLFNVFSEYKSELVALLYLNNENKVINVEYINGSFNERICVNPFRILDNAMNIKARKVVMCHNHPTQICKPSPEDIQATKTIKKMLSVHNIQLLNHHIFGIDGIYNFY